jgi:hypothetical protein
MYQVIAVDNGGTYYPIGFFIDEASARAFATAQSRTWTKAYVTKCKSATLNCYFGDASRWTITQ